MDKYSYILALLLEIQSYLKQVTVTFEEGTLIVTRPEPAYLRVRLNLADFPNLLSVNHLTERWHCIWKFLSVEGMTDEQCVLAAVLKEMFVQGNQITDSMTMRGELIYRVIGDSKTIRVDLGEPNLYVKSVILAIGAIWDNYKIIEHQGSDFTVIAPSGVSHAVNSYSCTCNTFAEMGVCKHLALVKTTKKHRAYMYKQNILKINHD